MTPQLYNILKIRYCDKQKHRYRTNNFGVTWCSICGNLSNTDAPKLEEAITVSNINT